VRLPATLPGGTTAAPQLITLLCAAAVAAQLALLAWKFAPAARRPPPAPPVAAAASGADTGALLHAKLFGTPAVATDGSNAPRTRVALVLSGTVPFTDPKAGLAIIGETAVAGRLYSVGAVLPGGVKLHEVYPDRVVLDRDGALETLPLPRQLAGGLLPGVQNGLSPLSNGNGTEPPLADNVQRLIAQGPEVIGEVLRPMPTFANGQLRGFRVYAGRDRRKFAKLGLQAGDLVTQINGVPLGDAQHGMEILRSLGSQGNATVTIERNGATQQLSVDTAAVASGLGSGATPGAGPADTPAAGSPAAEPNGNNE
jgi:general secretion pathway protein C